MTVEAVSAPPRESRVLRFAKGMALIRESWVGMLGLGIIVFWALVAIFADVLAPFPPNATGAALTLPGGTSLDGSAIHYIGTAHLGRDILPRIIHGSPQVLLYAPLEPFCAAPTTIPTGLAPGSLPRVTNDG